MPPHTSFPIEWWWLRKLHNRTQKHIEYAILVNIYRKRCTVILYGTAFPKYPYCKSFSNIGVSSNEHQLKIPKVKILKVLSTPSPIHQHFYIRPPKNMKTHLAQYQLCLKNESDQCLFLTTNQCLSCPLSFYFGLLLTILVHD